MVENRKPTSMTITLKLKAILIQVQTTVDDQKFMSLNKASNLDRQEDNQLSFIGLEETGF